MAFLEESPIENHNNDVLDRYSFSKFLARSIASYNFESSLTIGLSGEWGVGKTSVINMVCENFTELDNIVVMNFSPWSFRNREDLIVQFFCQISEILIKKDKSVFKKITKTTTKLIKIIDSYVEKLYEFSDFLPQIKDFNFLGNFFNTLKKFFVNESEQSLSSKKSELDKSISSLDYKILVVIDDIDRCSPSEICDFFQFIKAIADFKNLIYLISFDKKIVGKAFETQLSIENGQEYLEKIVQILIDMPKINNALFSKYCNDELCSLFKGTKFEDYFDYIYKKCISLFVENIRDIKRVINKFEFEISSIRNEVNPVDFLALKTIQLFDLELFDWISSNKRFLFGKSENFMEEIRSSAGLDVDVKFKKNRKILENKFKEKTSQNISILSALFPNVEKLLNQFYYRNNSFDNLDSRRICISYDVFDLYFCFSIEKITLSKQKLLLSLNTPEKFLEFLVDGYENGIVDGYENGILENIDEEFSFLIWSDNITTDELRTIFNVLLVFSYNLSEDLVDKNENIHFETEYDIVLSLIHKIFNKIGKSKAFDFINNALNQISEKNIEMLAFLIFRLMFAFGRNKINPQTIDEQQFVTEDNLDKLQNKFNEKIELFLNSKKITDLKNFDMLFVFLNQENNALLENQYNIFTDEDIVTFVENSRRLWKRHIKENDISKLDFGLLNQKIIPAIENIAKLKHLSDTVIEFYAIFKCKIAFNELDDKLKEIREKLEK